MSDRSYIFDGAQKRKFISFQETDAEYSARKKGKMIMPDGSVVKDDTTTKDLFRFLVDATCDS